MAAKTQNKKTLINKLELHHCKILSSHNTLITENAGLLGILSIGILVFQIVLLYHMPSSVEFDIEGVLEHDLIIDHRTLKKTTWHKINFDDFDDLDEYDNIIINPTITIWDDPYKNNWSEAVHNIDFKKEILRKRGIFTLGRNITIKRNDMYLLDKKKDTFLVVLEIILSYYLLRTQDELNDMYPLIICLDTSKSGIKKDPELREKFHEVLRKILGELIKKNPKYNNFFYYKWEKVDIGDKLEFKSINKGNIKLEDLMGKILFRFRGDKNHVANIEHEPYETGIDGGEDLKLSLKYDKADKYSKIACKDYEKTYNKPLKYSCPDIKKIKTKKGKFFHRTKNHINNKDFSNYILRTYPKQAGVYFYSGQNILLMRAYYYYSCINMNAFNIYKFIDFKEEEKLLDYFIYSTEDITKKNLPQKFNIDSIKGVNIDREFKALLKDLERFYTGNSFTQDINTDVKDYKCGIPPVSKQGQLTILPDKRYMDDPSTQSSDDSGYSSMTRPIRRRKR